MEQKTTTVRAHERVVRFTVDAGHALKLRNQGKSLEEIRAALNPNASLATISRAIQRAKEQQS
ncbi:MAG TPA: hypothetical protein VGT24_06310 [Candidatus Acidoferrales bacterium]|nr:hypothetical protein [Candidatus Acidoferrales bacterium]